MEVREFYDKIAEEYSDAVNHPTTAAVRKLEEELTGEIISGSIYDTVIDIGCADGSFLRKIRAQDKIGVDVSIEMIKLNSRQVPKAMYILGQFPEVHLETRISDLVHTSFVLDHVQDLQAFLGGISKVLKTNGKLILANFNAESMIQFRGGEENLRYRSLTGEVYEVKSDFHNLRKLDSKLEKYFHLERKQTVDVGIAKIKLDHYLMRKR
ncbi:methyltransferase domain-containing protein [Candidatus Woesearchaeota archaeon]|nr:methyltransferase domain-containing protein [Candidatus Woesearchaeota archaeon]